MLDAVHAPAHQEPMEAEHALVNPVDAEIVPAVQAVDIIAAEQVHDVDGNDDTEDEAGNAPVAAEVDNDVLDEAEHTTVSFDTAIEMLCKRARDDSEESEDEDEHPVIVQMDGCRSGCGAGR